MYDELFQMRNIGDYTPFNEFTKPRIDNLLKMLKRFIIIVKEQL